MNIWMFNHYAIPPQFPGGTRHFELSRNLAAQGHTVTLFASNFIHMNFTFVPLETGKAFKIENPGGFDFIWIKSRAYQRNDWKRFANMLDFCFNARKTALRLVKEGRLQKPDVIIGSTVHPFTPLMAARLAKKFGVPFVFEIRDLWPETFIDMGVWKRSSLQARLFKFIEKRTVKKADKIIALSPKTQSYLEEHYSFPASDIQYIPNGVYINSNNGDEKQGGEDREDSDTLQSLSQWKQEGKFTVLFSGSLITTNRLETIIEAARLLKDVSDIKIALIGKGQEEGHYRSLISEKELENIAILPPVRKNQVPALLRLADVLILNQGNVQWGSSNKLYDYMASQRPIISSVYARHNDLIAEVEGGISISPGDPETLKEAIRKLHHMPEEQKEAMGKRNRDYVAAHHDWKILAEGLSRMMENLNRK